MKNGALQNALKTERWLHVSVIVGRQQRSLFFNEFGQLTTQLGNIRVTGLENLVHFRDIKQREQQMLDRHKFMTKVACPLKRVVQAIFQFTA